ncbi:DNA repair protein RAD4 isoform X2 [Mangifera indica]|uniref:DNA repair protein RAD4 isoform X2 n=1 Tax=Mangifera indica TaxID=29780 RepID=UPI001CFC325E|nr:DNA repair protein RAD4 isoform X2 [Mangifera indica]
MRTRRNSMTQNSSSDKENAVRTVQGSEGGSPVGSQNERTLAETSKEAVGKLLRRWGNGRGSKGSKKQDNSVTMRKSGPKVHESQVLEKRVTWNDVDGRGCSKDAIGITSMEVDEERVEELQDNLLDKSKEMDDSDWEDGSIPVNHSTKNDLESHIKGVTIEFDAGDSARQKAVRRATAEEKELADIVHKVHLLCLLARGRIIDSACDEPLIQASLLSLLPAYMLKVSEVPKLTAKALSPIVSWFNDNFHVRNSDSTGRSFPSALAYALENREGTAEEIAALSVALFRALKLITRFVSILDVSSLKPEADKNESLDQDGGRSGRIFSSPTLMVTRPQEVSSSLDKLISCNKKENVREKSSRVSSKCNNRSSTSCNTQSKKSAIADELNDRTADSLLCDAHCDTSEACHSKESQGLKRKGDLEFEMQMQMALSATAAGSCESNFGSDEKNLKSDENVSSPFKRMKRIENIESSPSCEGISTAVGSRKVGSPLYWAEVYCSGENLTGKWVHVDAANAIIDGEQKVEAAASACKITLRYVVAFAGHGAKDVTRRYCMKWHKIASKRVNPAWWDVVLAPLRGLESGATGGMMHLEKNHGNLAGNSDHNVESSGKSSSVTTRNSLEDMELETRALTEPLPTNQQAYRNHQLYAIERWLNKYQILHPKGPVLGFCSGHPVYPRTSVQTLKTKERWMQEALQVKANELPAKVIKNSTKLKKGQVYEAEDHDEVDSKGNIELYGKWQLEPLRLPHAVNGIVPKNQRGQVDVWSEKCLPPGTVHLRLPRIFSVAKRLEIDYAPAMVGFEFRNGRSTPVFDGIVVCCEFEDIILEAYAEEEGRRVEEQKKRMEAQAISRWFQLLSSIVTRQRLNNRYGDGSSSQISSAIQNIKNNESNLQVGDIQDDKQPHECRNVDTQNTKLDAPSVALTAEHEHEHEHVYLIEDQSLDEESSVRTKRCRCGFTIQVEEL